MQCLCTIYRCSKKEGMYLYVDQQNDKKPVPEVLLKKLGKTELAMTLLLTEDKKLAHANVSDVLQSIQEKGFYLQMPPLLNNTSQQAMAVREKNAKL